MYKFKLLTNGLKILLLSFLLLLCTSTYAYSIHWGEQPYTHFSHEEPLREMLKSMASAQNISIVVSDKITDKISTYFRRRNAQEILEELKTSYELTTYFDGTILFIYKRSEIQHATVTLKKFPILSLEYELVRIGALYTDESIKWEVSRNNNSMRLSGPKRFIDIVIREAKKLDENINSSIYKWNTTNGITNYSNEPPFGENYKKVMVIKPSFFTSKEPSVAEKSAKYTEMGKEQ